MRFDQTRTEVALIFHIPLLKIMRDDLSTLHISTRHCSMLSSNLQHYRASKAWGHQYLFGLYLVTSVEISGHHMNVSLQQVITASYPEKSKMAWDNNIHENELQVQLIIALSYFFSVFFSFLNPMTKKEKKVYDQCNVY